MKFLILTLAALCSSGMALASDLDLKKELSCEAADGTKILVNSSLAGGEGKALAGSGGRALRAMAIQANGSVRISLDSGFRSAGPDYTLILDAASATTTSRVEGADSVSYLYIPGSLKASGGVVALKCFQDLN
ncbi:MAG: hypothetical protein EOP11_04730 [Proteobacteria bacterium]|nr:MAG: hypothetical protein EOP11_04730 [Pseudomonadota bacterium]